VQVDIRAWARPVVAVVDLVVLRVEHVYLLVEARECAGGLIVAVYIEHRDDRAIRGVIEARQ
jgi:predicted outer membrane lipoprotein